jgi:hypothetical protein
MRTPPDIDRDQLESTLQTEWAIVPETLSHVALGFGSHNWNLTTVDGDRYFVKIDKLRGETDEAYRELERAFSTALTLRQVAGLDFVVAPIATIAGNSVARLNDEYAVSVFPMIDGRSGLFGDTREPAAEAEVKALLSRLHSNTHHVIDIAGTDEFAIEGRDFLESALADLHTEWHSGPFSEPLRAHLTASADDIRGALKRYDDLVSQVIAASPALVITHGEPHPGNVMKTDDGLVFIDWDTALLAPAERDTWWLTDPADDSPITQLYRARWDLTDLSLFVDDLRQPHEHNEDTALAWSLLTTITGKLGNKHANS